MRNLNIIARYEVGRQLRSTGGVLFLALATIIYAYMALRLVEWASELKGKLPVGGEGDPGEAILTGVVGWLVEIEPGHLRELLAAHSPFALVFFFVALAINPLLAILGTADQTAGDIQTRHIRYLLLRTDRTTLYLGKTLGSLLFFGISQLILVGLVAGGALLAGAVGPGELLYFGRIWLTLTAFSLPFIALNGFSGALTGHPGVAMLVTLAYYMVIWLVAAVGSWGAPAVENIQYLSPSAFKFELAADDLMVLGKAAGHMALVGLVAFGLGLTLFRRRDV